MRVASPVKSRVEWHMEFDDAKIIFYHFKLITHCSYKVSAVWGPQLSSRGITDIFINPIRWSTEIIGKQGIDHMFLLVFMDLGSATEICKDE